MVARRVRELLRIVSINDVYDLKNLPRLGTFLHRLRDGPHTTLTVVNGDFLSPNVLCSLDKGRAVIDVFNKLQVTHLCLGNHEADVGVKEVKKRAAEFNGKWLNSNIPDLTSPRIVPYDIVTTPGGHRVGLIGLLLSDSFRDGTFKGLSIEPTLDAAQRLCEHLRSEGADLIVPLTHQSLADDRRLAEAGLNLPLILGGHEHDVIVERAGDATIVKAGSDCRCAAVCDITFPGPEEGGREEGRARIVSAAVEMKEVAAWAADAEVEEVLGRHLEVMFCATRLLLARRRKVEVLEQLQHEAIVAVRPQQQHWLPLSSRRCRQQPTTMGALVATACREELQTECAFINGASIAGNCDYPDGRITFHDLKLELPFPTKMISVAMPGRVLREAVAFSRTSEEERGFLQLDDSFVVPDGVHVTEVAGRPLDAEREYEVALPRNLLKGFAAIEPLVAWGKANAQSLPSEEDYRTAYALVVQHYALQMWLTLGNFGDIDADNNGVLDRREVATAVAARLERAPSETLVKALMNALDENGDGEISLTEFQRLRARHAPEAARDPTLSC